MIEPSLPALAQEKPPIKTIPKVTRLGQINEIPDNSNVPIQKMPVTASPIHMHDLERQRDKKTLGFLFALFLSAKMYINGASPEQKETVKIFINQGAVRTKIIGTTVLVSSSLISGNLMALEEFTKNDSGKGVVRQFFIERNLTNPNHTDLKKDYNQTEGFSKPPNPPIK